MGERQDQPPRVLVVDDELTFSTAIADTLQSLGEGYVVDIADNGSIAWNKIQKVVYELVITDLRMPQVDGLELMEKIRSNGINTRMILMTAYGSEDVKAKAKQLKVARYMAKPIDIDDLIDATREVLKSSSEAREPLGGDVQEKIQNITLKLDKLRQEISAHCIILSNAEGRPITYSGYVEEFDIPITTALIGAGHASFFELARNMSEDCVFNLMYNEGSKWNTFSTSVCKDLFLVIVFERDRAQTPIGMVWFSAKRTIAELLDIMMDLDISEDQSEIFAQLRNTISDELEEMLSKEGQDTPSDETEVKTPHTLISFDEAQKNGIVPTNFTGEDGKEKSRKKVA